MMQLLFLVLMLSLPLGALQWLIRFLKNKWRLLGLVLVGWGAPALAANSTTKHYWRCVVGHEWEATAGEMRRRVKKGNWCPKCRRVT